ncbi:MAG: hypothetical protein KAW52_06895 [candidate division Zixibacteria bacterium]|nr:hypothetical protein [candidate division Zixibacteria bacterium]
MNDTTPKIIERFNKMMLKLGAEKRLKMGFSMNETSRKIVVASLLDGKPQATPREKRLVLFNRFYQKEFDQKTCEKILKNLLQEK